jgi:hypothetical protein
MCINLFFLYGIGETIPCILATECSTTSTRNLCHHLPTLSLEHLNLSSTCTVNFLFSYSYRLVIVYIVIPSIGMFWKKQALVRSDLFLFLYFPHFKNISRL